MIESTIMSKYVSVIPICRLGVKENNLKVHFSPQRFNLKT